MFFDPFGDLGKIFILLSDVILLAEIDEVHDGFGTEEEERIYDFNLVYHLHQSRPSKELPTKKCCGRSLMSELDFISVRSLRYIIEPFNELGLYRAL